MHSLPFDGIQFVGMSTRPRATASALRLAVAAVTLSALG
jgi:hypothetical protein